MPDLRVAFAMAASLRAMATIAATTVVGINVSRDWLNGYGFPSEQRWRLANSSEGH